MSDASKKWSINYTWNQYQQLGWQPYQFQDFGKEEQKQFDDVKRVVDAKACEAEMARIEMVDRWVDSMHSYPDAEQMIKNIFSS